MLLLPRLSSVQAGEKREKKGEINALPEKRGEKEEKKKKKKKKTQKKTLSLFLRLLGAIA